MMDIDGRARPAARGFNFFHVCVKADGTIQCFCLFSSFDSLVDSSVVLHTVHEQKN